MADAPIVCPNCGKKLELSKAMTRQVEERLREEYEERLEAEKEKVEKAVSKKLRERASAELDELKEILEEKNKKLDEAREQEKALRKKARDLEDKEKDLADELERRLDEERKKIQAEATKSAQRDLKAKDKEREALLGELQSKVSEQEKQLSKFSEREDALAKKAAEVEEKEKKLAAEVQRRLEEETKKISERVREDTYKEFKSLDKAKEDRLEEMTRRLEERQKQLDSAYAQEKALRQRAVELEEKSRSQAIEMERQLDEERKKIFASAQELVAQEYLLKEKEKDKQLEEMKKQIEVLKRKAEQGSQQTQGEVLELEVEGLLRAAFPHDEVTPIEKGRKGGDILHTVRTPVGHPCGKILWETKRTKAWSDQWIQKVKDDLGVGRADIAVIVSDVLPDGIIRLGDYEGVWVTDFPSAIGLAMALRAGVIQLKEARAALVGKGEKMDLIYNYFTGPEFRRRVQTIVEAFTALRQDLEGEKRAMERIWAKRDKQIDRVMQNTAQMYGDIGGIVGAELPTLQVLELPAGPDGPDVSPGRE